MKQDFVDKIYQERSSGFKRALTQDDHARVNSVYPGCTLEYCFICGEPTGKAGQGEDSIYIDEDGPFCEECYEKTLKA